MSMTSTGSVWVVVATDRACRAESGRSLARVDKPALLVYGGPDARRWHLPRRVTIQAVGICWVG